jgi:hypothetical protein
MRRKNLAEIEDWPGLPRWLRDAMTGYLRVAIGLSRPYAMTGPVLTELVRQSGGSRIVDLASGGGGPWPELVKELETSLGEHPTVTLTDIRPNQAAAIELERLPGVAYRREPLSALEIPADLEGVRTIFTGLHHFSEAEVRSIFRSARDGRVPFLAAEATHRSLRGILLTLLVPLLVLLLMPRVRPRRALPLVLTYLPPIIPVLIWWDGFASTMRAYRAEELELLTSEMEVPGYSWWVEEVEVRGSPIPVTIVVGRPVDP